MPQLSDGTELIYRCPRRPYYEDPAWYAGAFEAFSWYRHGFLPDPGEWPDQSVGFLFIVGVMDKAIHDAEDKKRELEQARAQTQTTSRG